MRAAFTRAITLALPLATFACAIDERDLTVRPPGILLTPNGAGFVDGSNDAGILGYWTYFIDTPSCRDAGYSAEQCSTLFDSSGTAVQPGARARPDDPATGRICLRGVTAQALVNPATMQPDYAAIWGGGIELTFNDPDANVATALPYDAPAHMITGFSFETDTPPPSVIRVAFPTTASPVAGDSYWGGKLSWFSPIHPGLNVFTWDDVTPQFDSDFPPFDPRTILRMQFHVNAIAARATPFDFCIWNLSARTY